MQILLQALLAETVEGKQPTGQTDLEGEAQTEFNEILGLLDDSDEVPLDGEVYLIPVSAEPIEIDPNFPAKDGDILLPETSSPTRDPAPTIIEGALFTIEGLDQAKTNQTPESEAPATNLGTEMPVSPVARIAEDQVPLSEKGFPLPSTSAELNGEEKVRVRTAKPESAGTVLSQAAEHIPLFATQNGAPDGLIKIADLSEKKSTTKSETQTNFEINRTVGIPPATKSPQPLEAPVQPKAKPVKATEAFPKNEPVVEIKVAQSQQGTTPPPATIVQAAVVAPPVVQPLMQFEKLNNRDTILGADSIATTASAESDDVRLPTTNTARPEPAARTVISQVIQTAIRAATDGVVEVRLQPEELGRLRIAMTQIDTGVVVQVSAERPETLDLLRRNIDMLERDLLEQGFDNPSFSFEQGSADTNKPNNVHEDTEATASTSSMHIEVDVHPRQMVVNDGRLDIRL